MVWAELLRGNPKNSKRLTALDGVWTFRVSQPDFSDFTTSISTFIQEPQQKFSAITSVTDPSTYLLTSTTNPVFAISA
jgi:hypothetical protein